MSIQIKSTSIEGVSEIAINPFIDHRGTFFNCFRTHEFSSLDAWGTREIQQVNISTTKAYGAIRGLHSQAHPHSEAKIIRCMEGKVWDVAVDLRADSPTYGLWHSVELSAKDSNAILIPEGCAHGFQVLEPNSRLLYIHSGIWKPSFEVGVRWNDPKLNIKWPIPVTDLSERDSTLPFFEQT